MKRLLCALLALCLLLLSGCSGAASQVENQAYALSLGVEKLGEKEFQLSVQLPTLGGKSSGSEESGGEAEYLVASAVGRSFTEALDMLTASLPCRLQLSQLKTVVFSEATARDEQFGEILREIVFTYQLYAAASCIVCRGSAQEFLKAQRPVIGTRLSRALTVSLVHAQSLGYSPAATLADVFYAGASIYGDPIAILAALSGEEADGLPALHMGDELPGEIDREGASPTEYFGAALLQRGRMVGELTGVQTKLLSMLTGRLSAFSYSCQDVVVRLKTLSAPRIQVDLSGQSPQIDVTLSLRVLATDLFPDQQALSQQLQGDLDRLTQLCQQLGVDPFNYALHAASQFLTTRDWLNYDWAARFPTAAIRYHLTLSESQT